MEEDWKMDAEKLRNLLKDKQQRDAKALRGLIETAKVSDTAKLLLGIAAETIEHGARLTEERRERFEQEEAAAAEDWNASWDVTTLLAPLAERATLAAAGFYQMVRDGALPQRPLCFLATDYATSRSLAYEKTFEGRRGEKIVPYRLRFASLFIEAEHRLRETSELYHVTRPVIFSPWARRAVMVETEEADASEETEPLDLCLEANGLAGILREGQMLYWNFEWLVRQDADNSGRSPAFDDVHGVRTYLTEDQGTRERPEQRDFLLPEQLTGIRSVEKDSEGHQIVITGTNDWYEDSSERCELFRWYRPGAASAVTFANAFAKGRTTASGMLCTHAQLDYLLQQLTQAPFAVTQAEADKPAAVLLRYERGMAYDRDRTQELFRRRARGGQTIRLTFACTDAAQSMFLTDYANFVLAALERRAPYITWIAQSERDGEGAT